MVFIELESRNVKKATPQSKKPAQKAPYVPDSMSNMKSRITDSMTANTKGTIAFSQKKKEHPIDVNYKIPEAIDCERFLRMDNSSVVDAIVLGEILAYPKCKRRR